MPHHGHQVNRMAPPFVKPDVPSGMGQRESSVLRWTVTAKHALLARA
jgi:hypothetical protein